MSWEYGQLATEVYELDKPVGRRFPGLDYYARQLAGITGRILEPACGTGRVLIPLLEAGLTVEGVDTSPQMLARCRQHCADRGLDPVLHEADMTAVAETEAYQAIIIPAGSIMLLDGQDAAPRALAAFRAALVPGGRLILDIDVPSRSDGPAITSARYWQRDPYLWTLQVMHTSYDPVANQVTSLLRYEKWRDGGLEATELQRFRLQYWTLPEFGRMLAGAGFTDVTVTADYRDGRPPGPRDDVWTFQAVRPGHPAGLCWKRSAGAEEPP
jgi:SAM-dependent methyltransferase